MVDVPTPGKYPDQDSCRPPSFRSCDSDVSTGPSTPRKGSDLLWQRFWYQKQVMKVFERIGFSGTHDCKEPLCRGWIFEPNQIQDDTWGTVARNLMYQSSNKLGNIPFKVLLELVDNQTSPMLQEVLNDYKSLYTRICSFYGTSCNDGKPREHLRLVKELLEDEGTGADPLICTVVQDAYTSVVNKTTKERDLIVPLRHFVTDPIKEQLNEAIPHKSLLRRKNVREGQKKVLEARLKSYLLGSDNMWDKPFNANTAFLVALLVLEPGDLAERLTIIDHGLYRKLDVKAFQDKGEALKNLERRENDLRSSVTECLDARLLNEDRLFKLAKHLCDRSNYLSMNAVRKGVKFARFSSPEINQSLQNLVDVGQKRIMGTPGLYPLSRASSSACREKDTKIAEEFIDLCARYTIKPSCLTESWAEESESMKRIHTATVPGRKIGQSIRFSLSSTTLNTAFPVRDRSREMKYCPEKSVGIDERSNHPSKWSLSIRHCFGS